MRITAIMPCRNEAWVLGLSARAVLMWADSLILLDHASHDDTPSICVDLAKEYGERFTYLHTDDPVWEEMKHRQMLLSMARSEQATHVAIVDADEVLSGNLLPHGPGNTIWKMFRELPRGCVLQIPWLCLRGSIDQVHTSGPWADGQNVSTGFVDSPELHWSSAGRGTYDFHHRHPMGRACVPYLPVTDRQSGLMHLQFVSDRRLRAKQAKYQLDELLRWPGRKPVDEIRAMYSLSVYGSRTSRVSNHVLGQVPMMEWWAPYDHLMKHFHPDAEPWQEKAVRDLVAEHGRDRFAGLDLFGVA